MPRGSSVSRKRARGSKDPLRYETSDEATAGAPADGASAKMCRAAHMARGAAGHAASAGEIPDGGKNAEDEEEEDDDGGDKSSDAPAPAASAAEAPPVPAAKKPKIRNYTVTEQRGTLANAVVCPFLRLFHRAFLRHPHPSASHHFTAIITFACCEPLKFTKQVVNAHLQELLPYLLEEHRTLESVWHKVQDLVKEAVAAYPEGARRPDAIGGDMGPELKAALKADMKISTGGTGQHSSGADEFLGAAWAKDVMQTLVEYENSWLFYLSAKYQSFVDDNSEEAGFGDAAAALAAAASAAGGGGGGSGGRKAKPPKPAFSAYAASTGQQQPGHAAGETHERQNGPPAKQHGHDIHTASGRMRAASADVRGLTDIAAAVVQKRLTDELALAIKTVTELTAAWSSALQSAAKEVDADNKAMFLEIATENKKQLAAAREHLELVRGKMAPAAGSAASVASAVSRSAAASPEMAAAAASSSAAAASSSAAAASSSAIAGADEDA